MATGSASPSSSDHEQEVAASVDVVVSEDVKQDHQAARKKNPAIFEFYTNVEEKPPNAVEARCKYCPVVIKGQMNVTSNFVTHLKVWLCNVNVAQVHVFR